MMQEETVEWMGKRIPKYELLDYDTFKSLSVRGIPLFNNFFLYFTEGRTGEMYRSRNFFKQFESDKPELVAKTMEAVKEKWVFETMEELGREIDGVASALYDAYKVIKGYTVDGKPVSNYPDLFG